MDFPSYYPVSCHTDTIGSGSTFVAITGQQYDGHTFIKSALQKGALHIVAEKDKVTPDIHEAIKSAHATISYTTNARKSLAELSAHATDHVHKKLTLIGITGTKGKTTTAYLLYHLLRESGIKAALISTVKNSIDGFDLPTALTTPQPDYLHQFFLHAYARGVTHVVMEVAAQAVTLHRTYGLEFDSVLFTNFSHEHLEFYPTLDDYFSAKSSLFEQAKPGAFMLVNGDNEWCRRLTRAFKCAVNTFGTHDSPDYHFMLTDSTQVAGRLFYNNNMFLFSCPSLLGNFNAYNVVASALIAHRYGICFDTINNNLQNFSHVPGRMQKIALPNGAIGLIDYAHNPDSYQQLLRMIRQVQHSMASIPSLTQSATAVADQTPKPSR